MKKIVSGILAAGLVLSLAGCGSSGSASTAGSTAGGSSSSATGSVYWLNMKPESDEVLQKVAALYTEKTGVPCKVVTAASGTYDQTLTSEMDKTDAPTLFVAGKAGTIKTWGDYCYDLSGSAVAAELNTDAYNFYKEDGALASIGYCYESYGIIVNTDLLGKAGHSLDEIKDFASLKAVADDIHARAGELGFDAFTSSGMDDSSSWRFSGHLANMPLYYQSVDAGGWTEAPAEITNKYLDNYRNIWDLYITDSAVAPTSLATGGYDAEAEFVNGQAVFYQNGSWEYGACSALGDENIAMIPIYCGVAGEENIGLCSGTENCWAVNAMTSEANIKATLDFMYWCVTDAEASELLVGTFGVMPFTNAAPSTNKFLADANNYANEGKTTVTWAFSYTPNVDNWRAGVVSAMNQYDQTLADADWATVETAFVQGWANQYKAANG